MFKNMKTIRAISYLTVVAGLSFAALAQAEYSSQTANSYENKNSDSSSSKDSKFAKDTFATPADEQLNTKIRDKVSRGWLWDSYKEVILNTSNGVVTLEGTVKNKSDEEKLVSELLKIEGVKSVRSKLQITNSSSY